jgi:hypothetical protein
MDRNVVSLETARKLKAAGFPQEKTANWWFPTDIKKKQFLLQMLVTHDSDICLAAPTAQEIADQLPKIFELHGYAPEPRFTARCNMDGLNEVWGRGDTMAETLANLYLALHKMWQRLAEHENI